MSQTVSMDRIFLEKKHGFSFLLTALVFKLRLAWSNPVKQGLRNIFGLQDLGQVRQVLFGQAFICFQDAHRASAPKEIYV